jgi:hypothetical protein
MKIAALGHEDKGHPKNRNIYPSPTLKSLREPIIRDALKKTRVHPI